DAALDGADGDDLCTGFAVEQPGEMAADVAKALNNDAPSLEWNPEVARVLLHHVHDAAAGGLLPAQRAAQRHGLARDDRGAITLAARVLVEDPRHDLRVCIDVGRGDVAIGPEHDRYPLRESPGEPLEFELGELLGVDGVAPPRAAERNVHQRGLPRH